MKKYALASVLFILFLCATAVVCADDLINVALNAAVTVSNEDLGYELQKEKAVDGIVMSKGWAPSSNNNVWLQLDLGESYQIKRIELVTRQDFDQEVTRKNFKITASNEPEFSTNSVILGEQGSEALTYQATWTQDVIDTTAYRYIRFEKTVDNEYAFIAELRVLVDGSDEATGELVNIAEFGKSSASHNEGTVANGIDGKGSTHWEPTGGSGTGVFFQVDLGRQHNLKKIELLSRQEFGAEAARRNFRVLASNESNFNIYKVIAAHGNQPFEDKGTWAAKVLNSSKFRYVRIQKTAATEYFHVAEFRVFVDKESALPINSVNIAATAQATASSTDSSVTVANINDKNPNTYWAPEQSDTNNLVWVQLDLGKSYEIDMITLLTRQDGFDSEKARRNFEIQASNSSTFGAGEYQVIAFQDDTDFGAGNSWSRVIGSTEKFRYIRFRKTVKEFSYVAELGVYAVQDKVRINQFNLYDSKDGTGNVVTELTAGDVIGTGAVVENISEFPVEMLIAVCMFDQSRIYNIDAKTITFEPNQQEAMSCGVTLPNQIEGFSGKAFLWERDALRPVCAEIEIFQGQ